MSVIINTYDHPELAYDYQLCEDEDGTFHVWVTTGPLKGLKDAKGIETLEEAVKKMFEIMCIREGWSTI